MSIHDQWLQSIFSPRKAYFTSKEGKVSTYTSVYPLFLFKQARVNKNLGNRHGTVHFKRDRRSTCRKCVPESDGSKRCLKETQKT